MQTNLPDIKQLLTDWYLLTLENPLYAGALVLSVWLLTVFFYSIRLFFFKRKQRVTEQAGIKLQSQLDEAEQQNKQGEEKLASITEELANEQLLAKEFAFKVEERNLTIVESIKQLANKFDLNEQLVSSGDKPKAEFVWQQQDNIQTQLAERLQVESQAKDALQVSYNQEKEHFSKQEALIEQLQKTLDLQTKKSTQLEQDLNAQRLMQQQQKHEAEQKLAGQLADVQVKHKLEVASLVNELNQQKDAVDIAIKDKQAGVRLATEIESEKAEAVNDINVVESAVKEQVIQEEIPTVVETLQEQASIELGSREFSPEIKNLFDNKQTEKAEPTKRVEVLPTKMDVPEPEEPIQQVEVLAAKVPVAEPEDVEAEPDYTKSNLDIAGKFKGLFSKEKKQTQEAESLQQADVLATKVDVPEPEQIEEEPDYTQSNLSITGKFKGLFGKEKKQAEKAEPLQQADVLATKVDVPEPEQIEEKPDYTQSNLDITGKFKGLFGKEKKQAIETESVQQADVLATQVDTPEPEQIEEEPDYTQSNLNITGKFKGLFGKEKKQADKPELEPEQQAEVLMNAPREPELDDQEFEPDYTQSNLNISSKVKKLFGKS